MTDFTGPIVFKRETQCFRMFFMGTDNKCLVLLLTCLLLRVVESKGVNSLLRMPSSSKWKNLFPLSMTEH